MDLHTLLHKLANCDQILCYGRNMQAHFYVSLFAVFPEWDIADMLNGVNGVIPGFHIAGSVKLFQLTEPILMRRHVVGRAGVDKPYVFHA